MKLAAMFGASKAALAGQAVLEHCEPASARASSPSRSRRHRHLMLSPMRASREKTIRQLDGAGTDGKRGRMLLSGGEDMRRRGRIPEPPQESHAGVALDLGQAPGVELVSLAARFDRLGEQPSVAWSGMRVGRIGQSQPKPQFCKKVTHHAHVGL